MCFFIPFQKTTNGFYSPKTNSATEYGAKSKPSAAEGILSPAEEHFQKTSFEEVPLRTACLTYLGFYLLMILGYLNQLLFVPKVAKEKNRDGYVSLYDAFESFYSRYVYRRIRDCWNRPICSVPGAELTLKDRVTPDYGWSFEFTGTETRCLNLGSYNYLGFAAATGACADDSEKACRELGLALCSPRVELGTTQLHIDLEKLTARYLGVEDAIVFGMGFATNALNLPSLLSPGCLVLSDEKNHASIILGLRLSGATTKVFKHNNMKDLERVLRESVVHGNPKNGGKPWKKMLIIVEGVYSMEGSICRLPEIIALKKKYKAYLYLDEAHSIGALGPNGGGIVDYFNADPKDVDILMGTFTKSFGSAGGYIAGTKVSPIDIEDFQILYMAFV